MTFFQGNTHWPIVIMYGFTEDDYKIGHAAVMKGYAYQNLNLTLIIRNSLSGQKVFGDEVQPGEHTIEGKTTAKINEWNLGHEECHYFEFN